jgi:chromosome segregation ATPase
LIKHIKYFIINHLKKRGEELGLFGGKKKSRDDIIAEGIAQTEAEASGAGQEKKEDSFSSGNARVDIELTRIKAQLESLNEIRKANSERFSRVSEQMGELRGMIMDTNKTMSKIEVSATKAIDLVESVQPEKLMIEIRKQEGKAEALKANIESNEAMMRDLMEELKKIRQQMNFYKGIEQVVKLNEEVKGEILEIKKVEATIERHADKSESIFLDLEKKYAEFDKFQRTVDEVEKTFHAMQGDFDNMKLQLSNKAEKKEFGSLMDRFTEFEKHTGNIMKLLDERSKHMKLELRESIKKIKSQARGGRGLMLDEGMIREEKMPGEESEYLSKIDGVSKTDGISQIDGMAKIDGIAKRPEAEQGRPSEQKQEPSKAAKLPEEPGLGDILKKRRIITSRLSDEEEEK